jgi:hypothetical protein
MGRNAIDFNTFFRYAIPASQDAGNRWRSQLPLTVMRVRAPASVGPVKRYGSMIAGRRTARSEAYLAPNMAQLVNAVCHRTSSALNMTSADCVAAPPTSSFLVDVVRELDDGNWTGPYCRMINMNCDGDNSDTAFFYGYSVPLDPAALGDPRLQGMFFLGMRDYVLPGATLGPEASKLLKPRMLAFAPLPTFQGGGPHRELWRMR